MSKISPAYREDNYEGLPLDVKEYVDEHFLLNLPNIDLVNPRLLIVFSSGNAVGKSSLSQRIAKELYAVVLENDAIKNHTLQFNPDIDRDMLQLLTWQYTMDLYHRCSADIKNGLLVRDGVIDWYYDRILPIFKEQGYELFIIGYNLSRQKLEQLIRTRGDKPTVSASRLIAQLDDHAIHQRRFREVYKPDILLGDDNVFDHGRIIEMIRSRIKNLKHH